MATSNYINHENGLFILEGYSYEEAKRSLIEELEYKEDELEDATIFEFMNDSLEWQVEEYWEYLSYNLPKNLIIKPKDMWEAMIYNDKGKTVARLNLESGYYEGVQVIVTTDWEELLNASGWYAYDTMSAVYEDYSPHNKRLFKAIEKTTTPLNVVGTFSNGETVYRRA